MRALLVSTYDLGRQPFGLASPAAWLRRAGAAVECADASRDPLRDEQLQAAGLIAFYLPMHTATRLAIPLIQRARLTNPEATLVAYGLYAPLNASWLRDSGGRCKSGALGGTTGTAASHAGAPAPSGGARVVSRSA